MDALDLAIQNLKATPEHAAGEAALAPAPEIEAAPQPAPIEAVGMRLCRHCGAQFPQGNRKCPACGKAQSGNVKGQARAKPVEIAPAVPEAPPAPPPPPPKAPLTEKQLLQLEDALAETFTFALEDIGAPLFLRSRGLTTVEPPKLGEKRAGKLGAVWAPLLAPYIDAQVLIIVLALAVTFRSVGSYYRECMELAAKNETH